MVWATQSFFSISHATFRVCCGAWRSPERCVSHFGLQMNKWGGFAGMVKMVKGLQPRSYLLKVCGACGKTYQVGLLLHLSHIQYPGIPFSPRRMAPLRRTMAPLSRRKCQLLFFCFDQQGSQDRARSQHSEPPREPPFRTRKTVEDDETPRRARWGGPQRPSHPHPGP